MISHTFRVDKLNIGGSLESILHSYVTETPLIIDKPYPPVEIEKIHSGLDFSFLGFRKGETISALQLWDRLSFLLSLGFCARFCPLEVFSATDFEKEETIYIE